MMKYMAAALSAVVLSGCASLDFYAPEVGSNWTAVPVKAGRSIEADGVSVKKIGEEYSVVQSVGSLLAPAYQGGRKEVWSVSAAGVNATIEVIQTDLIFSGPVDNNVLKADTTDFTKGRQAVRVVSGSSVTSDVGPVTSPVAVKVGDWEVTPTYQGKSGSKVADYKSWGLTTGLRLTKGGKLIGYLSLTNGTTLLKAADMPADPLLTALALVAAQPHFEGRTPPQKLVPEVVDVFGLKFTTVTSHN